MEKKNRVYIVSGIGAKMANWNADFTGAPKTISTGEIFGSDKAYKYPIKKMWQSEGKKVVYIKNYKMESNSLQPRSLNETYKQVFGEDVPKKGEADKILKNLFSAIDIRNFGATFAGKDSGIKDDADDSEINTDVVLQTGTDKKTKGSKKDSSTQNISILGAVQVGQGFDKLHAHIETQDILSPFRNSNEKSEDSTATSIGKKTVVDHALYVYPISVNPRAYDDYKPIIDGYMEDWYLDFKNASMVAATAFNSNSKSGCENVFSIFVNMKTESFKYMANLDNYIIASYENEKYIVDISGLENYLKDFAEDIEDIELYYNPYICKIIPENHKNSIKMLNIITKKSI